MPPRFQLCPICQKGFGSASINIHIPQCYEKAMKRWRLNPVGPMPVMPHATVSSRSEKKQSGFADSACGNGVVGARSIRQHQGAETMTEYATDGNANLHPCSRCGRRFVYDRIAYHESVCKGDSKRKVFNSQKQRATEDEYGDVGRRSISGARKKGGRAASSAPMAQPAMAPRTHWREQHREFIDAIRSARRAESSSKAMWGAPAVRSGPPPPQDSRGRAPPAVMRHQKGMMQARQQRTSQPEPSHARATPASRPVPPKRPFGNAFGGGGERFSGRPSGGGGGGGGGKILNDNTTSLGMLQAFGRA